VLGADEQGVRVYDVAQQVGAGAVDAAGLALLLGLDAAQVVQAVAALVVGYAADVLVQRCLLVGGQGGPGEVDARLVCIVPGDDVAAGGSRDQRAGLPLLVADAAVGVDLE